MTLKIFISNKNIDENILLETLQHKKILCNVTKYKSIIFNKTKNTYEIEPGFKIEPFNINHKGIIALWDALRVNLKIHCLYIKSFNYEGCITRLPEYLNYCKKNNIEPLTCSEYEEA